MRSLAQVDTLARMQNSLDLDPEFGDVDLVQEVEAVFGIKFAREDLEQCDCLGDLYGLIRGLTPDWDDAVGKCNTAMVFYRVRRSLSPLVRREISPCTPLAMMELSPRVAFKQIQSKTSLRVPAIEASPLAQAAWFILIVCALAGTLALVSGERPVVLGSIAIAAIAFVVARKDRGRFPRGMATVADLVRRVAALNAAHLKQLGAKSAKRWDVLIGLVQDHTDLPAEDITADTVFFRRQLKRRSAA